MNENKLKTARNSGPGRRRLQAALILSAVVLLIAGYVSFRGNGNGPAYRTENVSRGDITASVTATGTLNAVTTVLVGTQVSGTIRDIFVDFNSAVKKGQIIAQIDPDMLEAQAQQAKANLIKADAQMRDAERTYKRNRELFSRNLVPRSDLDTAETNFEGARAQLELSKAALRQAETNLRHTRIISPVDGIVISRNVDVGQTVAASFQTPTLFTIAQDLTKMQINTSVAEADIGAIKAGQEAEFTVDAYPESSFRGEVWQIRRAPITVQNVVTYDVVVQVNNGDLRLMPGMTANVSIVLAVRKDVLKAPIAALRFRPSEKPSERSSGQASVNPGAKGPGVWILVNNNPKRIGIAPGISDGAYIEVLPGDLKEGQTVIVETLNKNGRQRSAGPRMF